MGLTVKGKRPQGAAASLLQGFITGESRHCFQDDINTPMTARQGTEAAWMTFKKEKRRIEVGREERRVSE